MSIDEDVQRIRRMRKRRSRHYAIAVVIGMSAYLTMAAVLPDGSQGSGLMAVAVTLLLTVGQRFSEGMDDFQRLQMMRGFIVGAAVGIGWLMAEVVWTMSASAHETSAGTCLNVMASAWLLADFGLRVREQLPTHRR